MELIEFEKELEQYEKDELTADIIYDLCVKFKSVPLAERREYTWESLNEYFGNFKSTGENLRCWVKARQGEEGTLEKNPKVLSNQNVEDLEFEEFEAKTRELKEDLYKQQVKTRDAYSAYNRKIRDVARVENFKDLMIECAQKLNPIKLMPFQGKKQLNNEAVLLFSDLHIGMKVDKFCNTYNVEVAKERVSKLVSYTIDYCKVHNVKRLNVLLLGDAIHGLIHINARLEQELNVVEQIITASQIIAQAIGQLQQAAPEVVVRSCTDNHSRAVASLSENIEEVN